MRQITNFFSIRSENRLKIDLILLGVGFILLMIGMVMVSSASIAIADDQHGDPFFFLKKVLHKSLHKLRPENIYNYT